MANKLQIRRGTKTALDLITLAAGELGWASDTKGLYIGDGANNKLYATEYIDWSATGAEQIHADRLSGILSGVLLADGTIPLTANWNIGNYYLGINTVPSYPLHLSHSPGDETFHQVYANLTPSGTHTGARHIWGIKSNIASSAGDGGFSSELRGIESSVSSSGDIHNIYGGYFYAYYSNAAANHLVSGSYNGVQVSAGTPAFIYGVQGRIILSGTSGGGEAHGLNSSISMTGSGILACAYGVQSYIYQSAGTLTAGYLFKGSFSGTIGTKWGIWLSGETKNYFSGQVGIKEPTPAADLDIAGTLILLYGGAINEFSIDGTLAGDSDDAVPTEKAVKAYVDNTGFQSKVSAHRTATQSIPNITWTKVQLNVEAFDGLGEYDHVTNYRFTASESGYYTVVGQIGLDDSLIDTGRLIVRLYKNGATVASTKAVLGGSSILDLQVSKILYLAATEYLELFCYHNQGSALNLKAGAEWNFLTVHRLS